MHQRELRLRNSYEEAHDETSRYEIFRALIVPYFVHNSASQLC